jgi:uncharacterized protein DUF4249
MKYLMIYISIFFLSPGCKKPYDPPEISEASSLLVVEGVINGNPASITTISLSRLRNLNDTSYNQPEFSAQIMIEEEGGSMFPLYEKGNGDYSSNVLTLNPPKRYRLLVNTVDGKNYASDFTTVLQTPPIDTLTWEQNSSVSLYVNTHDPLNQTHYYRWDYVETWEYHSFYKSEIKYIPDTVVYDNNSTHVCWQTGHSTDISLGNTTALSSDVITHARIGTIPHNSQKCSERYSALVRQYALSREAYQYWLVLQKLSEQAGTLFDIQPSQLQGNIHSLSGNEPVIGYISASTIPEKRMFINHSSLTNWKEFDGNYCDILGIVATTRDITHSMFSNGYYAPYYFTGMGGYVTYTWTSCVDCRTQGGTLVKPSFW